MKKSVPKFWGKHFLETLKTNKLLFCYIREILKYL